LKILLAGLGSIGQRHARNLRALLGEEATLLAYRARRAAPLIGPDMTARAGDPESAYGIRSFDDLDQALAERPDAVFVTNPPTLHVPVALAAVRAGSHVFLEKPVSDSEEGLDELAEAIEEAGVVCAVGYQLRFHPGFRLLRDLLVRAAAGTALAAHFEFGEDIAGWHPWEDYRHGTSARADLGGGVLLTQIHDLDIAYALFGRPRRVFASGGKRSSLDLDVEDTADIVLDGDRVSVHVHQDLLQWPPTRLYRVIGERGTIVWDYYANTVVVSRRDGTETTAFGDFDRNQLFLDEVAQFLCCIRDGDHPAVGLGEGIESLRIALAARRSLETREAVPLEPL
jgi:predicted dehydrogenase